MNRTNLGEFEELVLLTVGVLYNNAYSVAITKELENQSGRKVNISAVHPVLYRLEEKGLLTSRLGEATAKRGGKRKRLFTISSQGKTAMDGSMNLRMKLRQKIPSIALENL
jgi:DNA-binding PadR family transcriptional regulator